MSTATRIIGNTVSSYGRLLIFAAVGFLGTPIVLRSLGASDYGIFAVTASSLAYLSYINSALTNAAQRHIAYALGEHDTESARRWFRASLLLHSILAILVGTLTMLGAHWVTHKLNLPAARLVASMWVYRISALVLACNYFSTPYTALLLAHEAITSLSVISSCGAVALAVGIFVLRLLPGDTLLWYAAIFGGSQLAMVFGPIAYAMWRFPEYSVFCRSDNPRGALTAAHSLFRTLRASWKLVPELLQYSGWNLFTSLSFVVRTQGPAVLLNVFFGTVANASYGLAMQVCAFGNNVSWGVLNATSSPICKYFAAGNRRSMAMLSSLSSIFSFMVLWLGVGPFLFDARFCLRLWLRDVPPNIPEFLLPLLIALLIDQLTSGLNASIQATGRIAGTQVFIGCTNISVVVLEYVLVRSGTTPVSVLWVGVALVAIAGGGRLWFAHEVAGMSIGSWVRDVLIVTVKCVAASSAAMIALTWVVPGGLPRLALLFAVNLSITVTTLWYFGTSEPHQEMARTYGARLVERWRGSRKLAA